MEEDRARRRARGTGVEAAQEVNVQGGNLFGVHGPLSTSKLAGSHPAQSASEARAKDPCAAAIQRARQARRRSLDPWFKDVTGRMHSRTMQPSPSSSTLFLGEKEARHDSRSSLSFCFSLASLVLSFSWKWKIDTDREESWRFGQREKREKMGESKEDRAYKGNQFSARSSLGEGLQRSEFLAEFYLDSLQPRRDGTEGFVFLFRLIIPGRDLFAGGL